MFTQETKDLQQFQRRLARKAFGASVIVAVVIFALGYTPIAKGLVLGALFSVLNFVVMASILPFQLGLKRRKATGFAILSIMLRLGLLALPLIIAMKSDSFQWTAVAVGLFVVPVTILIDQGILRRFYPKRVHL